VLALRWYTSFPALCPVSYAAHKPFKEDSFDHEHLHMRCCTRTVLMIKMTPISWNAKYTFDFSGSGIDLGLRRSGLGIGSVVVM